MSEPTLNPNEPPRRPDGWELVCAGILGTEFGRRQSRAVLKAVMQLSAEEALTKAEPAVSFRRRFRNWWLALRPFPRFTFATGLLLVVGFVSWNLLSAGLSGLRVPSVSVCKVADMLDAQWAADSAHPKIGDELTGGTFRLASGVVQLVFETKAKVAIEGPAQFTISDFNAMGLTAGKLSAEVPPRAHGFSVRTPNATVVDLGTRFGLDVAANHSGQIEVFEGTVRLTPIRKAANAGTQWLLTTNMAMAIDANGRVTAAPPPLETAFPQISKTILTRPVNCGFDLLDRAMLGGMPSAFGNWSGPAYALSGPVPDIQPVEGAGMLRFLAPAGSGDSEVWQLIDLRPFKNVLARGDVQIRASAFFNRIRGDDQSANQFALAFAAFHGQPLDATQLWARRNDAALAVAEKVIATDNDPATWEKAEISAPVPAAADFLIVSVRAIRPAQSAAGADPFPGHFADVVDCSLFEPLHASGPRNQP